MIVISDTSVITNLIQLDELKLLHQLFGDIIIPSSVFEELEKLPEQAEYVRQVEWVEIQKVSDQELFEKLLETLDPGESESIVLALELKADLLLIDEKKGRKVATEYGINITGLLGILIEAKESGFIKKVKPILDQLIYEVGFRISPKLYQEILEIVNE